MLDKRQNVFYSVENVLKMLLDNDKFIDNYMQKARNQLQYVDQIRLSASIDQSRIDTSQVLQIYDNYYNEHTSIYHKKSNSGQYVLAQVSADYIKTDMSNFDANGARQTFQHCIDGETNSSTSLSSKTSISLSNDIVTFVEFSEDVRRPMNYVNVLACNKMTGGKFRTNMDFSVDILAQVPQLTSTTYIYKEWLSGIKELYVHIPTTFTMYNENLHPEADNYYEYENVKDNMTIVQVKINRRHFKWNNIYQAYICGQSLPLQIHSTNDYKHFSDVILPSMLKTMCVQPIDAAELNNVNCIYDENQSMYTLYFICYGTDEQAIRIIGE